MRYLSAGLIIGVALLLAGLLELAAARAHHEAGDAISWPTSKATRGPGEGTPQTPRAARPDANGAPEAMTRPPSVGQTIEMSPKPYSSTNGPATPEEGPSPNVTESHPEGSVPFIAASLEQAVRSVVDESASTFGVVVQELAHGRRFEWNADQTYYAASLYKLMVMYEVYQQYAQGLLSLDETLVVSERAAENDLGTLQFSVGDELTVRQALEAMITYSDNTMAVLLMDRVGAGAINADMAALGLTSSGVFGVDDIPTNALDMSNLLRGIGSGEAVSVEASAEMLNLLLAQGINDRLPALLPPSVSVAHKTGNWDGATHDVGIVFAPGATYVIAVLSDSADGSEPIAEMSRRVYDYFETYLAGLPEMGQR